MGTTRATKLWLRCLLCLLGLLSLLSLLCWRCLLLRLPLRLNLINSMTPSCNHDGPRWTTMKALNTLNSLHRSWWKQICNNNSTASTSSIGTLCGLSNCGCSSYLCIRVLALL